MGLNHIPENGANYHLTCELGLLYQIFSGSFGLGIKRASLDKFANKFAILGDALSEDQRLTMSDVITTLYWAWTAMCCYYPMKFGDSIEYLKTKTHLN